MNLIRPKRLLAFVVFAAFVAFAIGHSLFPKNEAPINESLYERLALGMTAQEVDRAIGYAPGDYSGANAYTTSRPMTEGELPLGIDYRDHPDGSVSVLHPTTGKQISGKRWRGNEGLLIVFFGDDNRVIDRRYYPGYGRTWLRYHWDRLVR